LDRATRSACRIVQPLPGGAHKEHFSAAPLVTRHRCRRRSVGGRRPADPKRAPRPGVGYPADRRHLGGPRLYLAISARSVAALPWCLVRWLGPCASRRKQGVRTRRCRRCIGPRRSSECTVQTSGRHFHEYVRCAHDAYDTALGRSDESRGGGLARGNDFTGAADWRDRAPASLGYRRCCRAGAAGAASTSCSGAHAARGPHRGGCGWGDDRHCRGDDRLHRVTTSRRPGRYGPLPGSIGGAPSVTASRSSARVAG
jgi:hypothetical protein